MEMMKDFSLALDQFSKPLFRLDESSMYSFHYLFTRNIALILSADCFEDEEKAIETLDAL